MKETLKELAELLPSDMKASIRDIGGGLELSMCYGSIFEDGSIYSAVGVYLLIEFIEKNSRAWTIVKYSAGYTITFIDPYTGEFVYIEPVQTLTEAVAKAALEVAKRIKS